MTASAEVAGLRALAEAWGLVLSYTDAFGHPREASPEALLAVLRGLGAPLEDMAGVPAALRDREFTPWRRMSEPVVVVWEGEALNLDLRIPSTLAEERLEGRFEMEGGEEKSWSWRLAHLLALEDAEIEGARFVRKRLTVRRGLARGYHRLTLTLAGRAEEILVIAAPHRAHRPAPEEPGNHWGVFLPLYSLRSGSSWGGVGDLADLESLAAWVAGLGGNVVGTLPLLAAFLDEPCEPSPYAPASRLFWNELFLNVPRIPEFSRSTEARELTAGADWRREEEALRRGKLVEYRQLARLKRRVVEHLARAFFDEPGEREADFRRFLLGRPGVDEYARFRAAVEKQGTSWHGWAEPARAGALSERDFDEDNRRYHLYAQWQAQEQVDSLRGHAAREGVRLYLDLPLGVHAEGFDVWRERESFALGLAAGAPPDLLFSKGQNWGFPLLHPERARAMGHRYLRASLGHLFRHADLLRIDHVMGLHRLYVIPDGFAATEGVYVTYPREELYSIVCLESRRHHTLVIGEDLGTVAPEVRPALAQHGIRRSYVVEFEFTGDAASPLAEVPDGALAALDTHDTATFAGFWRAGDLETWRELGFLGEVDFQRDLKTRRALTRALSRAITGGAGDVAQAGHADALRYSLEHLARSRASMVLVNLEDLWHETEPQNIPGTRDERPNWRRKAARAFEEFTAAREVSETLRRVNALRGGDRKPAPAATAPAPAIERSPKPPAPPEAASAPAPAPAPPPSVAAPSPVPVPAPLTPPTPPTVLSDVSNLTADDLFLFNEGSHLHLHEKLGAHAMNAHGRDGVLFAVWAPNATGVSVLGDFNGWNEDSHPLVPRGQSGIWEGFIPGVGVGSLYKYRIVSRVAGYRVVKADPVGARQENPPSTASRVWRLDYDWHDGTWMAGRSSLQSLESPISVYELHLGSWMRLPEHGYRSLSYRELAPILGQYVKRMGFTHVEFMPVMEHPFAGSWGYQVTGYFAPTSRFGTPQDLMFLVDHLHQMGIGVILDWVPSHFPSDNHGLAYFDGTRLYEHEDPRRGWHPDWDSLIFNYDRHEVRSFLLSSAFNWLETYHADGLRVDAVASMLYLDYSRKEGQWEPNRYGGRENLGALEFLRRLSIEVGARHPDALMIAEESTAWPMVSRPVYVGGLGFSMKWDMGWMHDMLEYMGLDPIFRKFHHGKLTFRNLYAWTENFMLPLSHDEVVHGKRSLLDRMPGDRWQKFANLRLLLGAQYAQPGKKLLFMGGEFGQWREWDHDGMLSWDLLEYPDHRGVQRWVEDLNRAYREEPALHRLDLKSEGFEWVDLSDFEGSVISFLRRGTRPEEVVLVVANFTPVPRDNYLVGVPRGGFWQELLNSDAENYGGSGKGNLGGVLAGENPCHGRPFSLALTLPPLGILFLKARAEPAS